MTPWLSIVGIGEDGLDGLAPAARTLIAQAEVLVGGPRHLAMVPDHRAERLAWGSPFADTLPRLQALRGRRVCVMASGDPMWFGVGSRLARLFPPEELTIVPHPGAFSLAAAGLGWSLADTTCLTIHGRPVEGLLLHLHPGRRLLVLSQDGASPAQVAVLLTEHGCGDSRLTVLERLGGQAERRRSALARDWDAAAPVDDLNTLAIEVEAAPDARILGVAPGLPDDAYLHDGQLTKRELRAATLAALAPWPGARLWDVGAGCGSIAIEWARCGGRAVAIERDGARCDLIARNAARLGVPGIPVVAGEAPAVLAQAGAAPDAIFVGGGLTCPGVLEACWQALRPGGRLVANAVTAEAEAVLLAWQAGRGGDLARLAVSRLVPTGRFHTWHPLKPVTQYSGRKP
jgi:precorrin-6B C5,15-methyltransferase / cobalt-precorrin-6B C5,C15-methyltransferase